MSAVKIDSSLASAGKKIFLAQISSDKTNYRFPPAIAEAHFVTWNFSVKFKPISDRDQAAGLGWRPKDANNYYIVRANALEGNVVLYKVQNGKRTDLPLKRRG